MRMQCQGQAIGEQASFLLRQGAVSDAALLVGLSENNTVEARESIRGKEGQPSGLTSGLTRPTFALQLGKNDVDKCISFSSRYSPDGFCVLIQIYP